MSTIVLNTNPIEKPSAETAPDVRDAIGNLRKGKESHRAAGDAEHTYQSEDLPASSDYTSPPIYLGYGTDGMLFVNWVGIDAVDCIFCVEVSNDGVNFNTWKGSVTGPETGQTTDQQGYMFLVVPRYMRVTFAANSVTSGTWNFNISVKAKRETK